MARRGLPGLKALRAFEAVAFHESFTLAADELAVSQGAVSHQIKQIEDQLGVRLFHRSARGVSLTPQGLLLKGNGRAGVRRHLRCALPDPSRP